MTEAPGPAVEGSVLAPQNSNITKAQFRDKCLMPTQHRLLMGKKPGIERLSEQNLAELTRQTQDYMDNVVENFRKIHQPMGQDNASGPDSPGKPILKSKMLPFDIFW